MGEEKNEEKTSESPKETAEVQRLQEAVKAAQTVQEKPAVGVVNVNPFLQHTSNAPENLVTHPQAQPDPHEDASAEASSNEGSTSLGE